MTTDPEEALTETDRAALTRAVELYRTGSPTQRRQIDAQLAKGDDWEDVATYCAFHMQMESLHLPPWQPPPCRVHVASALNETDPQRGYRAVDVLRQRMAAAGVSKWAPNPVAACEAVEAEQRRRAAKSEESGAR